MFVCVHRAAVRVSLDLAAAGRVRVEVQPRDLTGLIDRDIGREALYFQLALGLSSGWATSENRPRRPNLSQTASRRVRTLAGRIVVSIPSSSSIRSRAHEREARVATRAVRYCSMCG